MVCVWGFDVSGKALAADIAANPHDQESVASAIPLTYFSNDAWNSTSPAPATVIQGIAAGSKLRGR